MSPPEQNASASRLQTPIGERDYTTGPADAPVTLLEYGDYECPYSRKGYQLAQRLLQMEAPALRFAFRQFPLTNIHPHAESAAEAALAAGAQGHFWEMSSRLFEHQDALERADLRRHAEQLGLDADAVDEALRTERFRSRVHADTRSGLKSGVDKTPVFFVNGRRYDGPLRLKALQAALQRAGDTSGSAAPNPAAPRASGERSQHKS